MKNLVFPSELRSRSIFFKELAQLTRAGFVAADSFAKLNRPTTLPELRTLASTMASHLKQSKSYEQILKSMERHLPPLDLAMMMAGHRSGRLDQCYDTLSTYYEHSARLRSKIITQLMYPTLLAHGAILIFPTAHIAALFNVGVGAFIKLKIVPFAVLWSVIGTPFLILTDQSDTPMRRSLERWLLKIPVFGTAMAYANLARFAMSLEGLVSAGINADESWPLAAKASGSFLIEDAVKHVHGAVRAGKFPGDVLVADDAFPSEFIDQLRTANQAGDLDNTLKRMAKYYEELANDKFQIVSDWVPRVLYFIVLISIAYNIVTGITSALPDVDKFQ